MIRMGRLLISLAPLVATIPTALLTALSLRESARKNKHDELKDLYDRVNAENEELRDRVDDLEKENQHLRDGKRKKGEHED